VRCAAAVVAGAALALSGCGGGGGERRSAGLEWKQEPLVFRATHLPADRVLTGTVENRSKRSLHIVASDIRVRDAHGAALRSYAQFVNAYAHGLYGAYQKPKPLPPNELSRLGLVVTLPPGSVIPLTVAYRVTPKTRTPLRVDYGGGSLSVPSRVRHQSQ
jgi:hypothetical protein